ASDVYKIQAFGKSITDKTLYNSVVKHRSIFNKIEGMDYELHHPSLISFIPPESIIEEWKTDYRSMQKHFIYEDESLSFDELIARMKELTERIRKL
ncbi:MAG: nucleotidyl transferase AbiEii/AbiGii toxin family protein, partial [Muribaculaceae bacterium]|nr:nucleotidyl transferase AbiEii/AbiGii toxin family protein [Muribaculaceae bacterium]